QGEVVELAVGAWAMPGIKQGPKRSRERVEKARHRIVGLNVPADMGEPESVEVWGMRIAGHVRAGVVEAMVSHPLNGGTCRNPQADSNAFEPFREANGAVRERAVVAEVDRHARKQVVGDTVGEKKRHQRTTPGIWSISSSCNR